MSSIQEGLKVAQEILNAVAEDAQGAANGDVDEFVVVGDLEGRAVKCIESIRKLNQIMGNGSVTQFNPDLALQLLTNQESIFIEERNETFEAIRHECYQEVIDGLADMFVVQIGLEVVSGWVTTEDIEEGRVSEEFAGHTGGCVHSEGVGVLFNVIRNGSMDAYNVARIAAEKLFIGKVGVDPTKYLEAVTKSLELICENNLSKATTDFAVAADWYENFSEEGLKNGYHPAKTVIDGVTWYFIKDGNGKFRKPYNYKSVDLSGVMEELLSGVPLDKMVPQDVAYANFLKATKGV